MVAGFTFCTLLASGCASRSHSLYDQAMPSISAEAVNVYPAAPAGAKRLGVVTVSYYQKNEPGREAALNELKKEAAKIGANGILTPNLELREGLPTYGGGSKIVSTGDVAEYSAQAFFVR